MPLFPDVIYSECRFRNICRRAVNCAGPCQNISSSTAHIISKTSGHADTSTSKSLHIISLDRLETSAKDVMTEAAYAYIAHGAGDEWTYHENRRAFSDYPCYPHRLSGVAAHSIDIRTDLLGHHLEHPR